MARRHVSEGQQHVRRQREIVAELQAKGADTRIAEELLVEFEQTLEDHLSSLNRMLGGGASTS